MGTAVKHPVPDRVKPSFVIFDLRAHPGRQSARMSKITNDGLTRFGTTQNALLLYQMTVIGLNASNKRCHFRLQNTI